jgi:phage terminase large subunit GpA-like protein
MRVKLFAIGTDTAKELIYSRLKITELGAGYCHFPTHYDESYFKQLTAEKVVTRYNKGFPVRKWEKPAGRRNEALDCRVYALAALHILNPNLELLAAKLKKEKPQQQATDQIKHTDPVTSSKFFNFKRDTKAGFVKNW